MTKWKKSSYRVSIFSSDIVIILVMIIFILLLLPNIIFITFCMHFVDTKDVSVLTGGIRLPVHYNVQNQSISNINKLIEYAKQSQRVEYVYCLYRARVLKEEQLCIVATVTSSTSKTFKKSSAGSSASKFSAVGAKVAQQPAVSATQNLIFTMPLPSVVQLDTDLFSDFAANVVQSLKIEHDARTGINSLTMQSST